MVTRATDPQDARAVLIRIIPAGKAALRQARLDRGAAVDPYLARLSDTQQECLAEAVIVLRQLVTDAATATVEQSGDNPADEVANKIGDANCHPAEGQLPQRPKHQWPASNPGSGSAY